MAQHPPDAHAAVPQHGVHEQDGGGPKKCQTCGLAKPPSKPLQHLGEHWHGLTCAYCYGSVRYHEGDPKEVSLTRRAHFETWVAKKLLCKRGRKPKGKVLGPLPDKLRTDPFAMAAFAGQLQRTLVALEEAGLADLVQPLREHMKELGL